MPSPFGSASSQAEAQALNLLALSRVKGLGDEGIARILAEVRRQGSDLDDFFRASPERLRGDYRLRDQAARTIGEQQQTLREQAAEILARARELGVVLLPPGDPAYPDRIATFYHGEPPLLYARGNLGLLETRSVALLNSARPSPEDLENTLGLARRLSEAGVTLLASPEGASHNLVGTAARQAEGQAIVVLHQGLLTVFDGHPERDSLPLSRRIEQKLDLERTLILSPFRMDGRWQRGNGPRRDMLLAALAGTLIAVHLRTGGTVETLCREGLGCGKRVFICQ
jgi:predicted Rossmann fold nucleotide-binding protein DprA/Smf involved in DNA uptake